MRRALLPLALLGLAVVTAIMAWVGRDPAGPKADIVRGGDFVSYWAGGAILAAGDDKLLYRERRAYNELKRLFPEKPPGYTLAYPPPVYQACATLHEVPYPTAARGLLWALSLLAAAGNLLLVRAVKPLAPWGLEILAFLVISPAILSMVFTGQFAGLWLAALGGAAWLGSRGRPFWGGVLLGVLWAKPTLAAPVALALVALGQGRMILGFTTGGAVLTAVSWVADPVAWEAYIGIVRKAPDVASSLWIRWPRQFTLRTLVGHLATDKALRPSLGWAGVVLGLGLVGWTAWWAKKAGRSWLGAGAVLSAALLATPHLFDYDLGMHGIGLAASAAWLLAGRARHPRWGWGLTTLTWLAPATWALNRVCHVSLGVLPILGWVVWMGLELRASYRSEPTAG